MPLEADSRCLLHSMTQVGMDDFQAYIQQVAPGLQRMQAVSGHGAPAWLARPLGKWLEARSAMGA